ncbi:MAG TPA: hypothetical protein VK614_00065 [Allosphingosinicella sp.]|nr:hypothetical protein [Allosphingosinicella sp.]
MRLHALQLAASIAMLLAAVPADPAHAADGRSANFIIVGSFSVVGGGRRTAAQAVEDLQTLVNSQPNGVGVILRYPGPPGRPPTIVDENAVQALLQGRAPPMAVMWGTSASYSGQRLVTHTTITVGSAQSGSFTFYAIPAAIGDNPLETGLGLYRIVLAYARLVAAQQAGEQLTQYIVRLEQLLNNRDLRQDATSKSACLTFIRDRLNAIGRNARPAVTSQICSRGS